MSELNDRLAELLARQAKHNATADEIAAGAKAVEAEMSECDMQAKALEAQLAEINRRKAKLSTLRFDAERAAKRERQAARALNDEAEELKRKAAIDEANRLAAEKNAANRVAIDDATADAVWRVGNSKGHKAFPHQLDGAHFLTAAKRALCADDMGLGKTLQSFMWLDMLQASGESKGRALIIAPGGLCDNYELESQLWAPDRAVVNLSNLGTAATIEQLRYWQSELEGFFETPDYPMVVLINYEILGRSREVRDALIECKFDSVVMDEAHRIKNTGTKAYKAAEEIVLAFNTCCICGEITSPDTDRSSKGYLSDRQICLNGHGAVNGNRSVDNFLAMTGTPILNRPDEMYPLLHLIKPDIFQRLYDFTQEFCWKGYDGKMRWNPGGESRLASQISGFYIRRTRLDAGIKLPPQTIQVHDIKPEPEFYLKQRKFLKMLREKSSIEIEEGRVKSIFDILPLITRQRQGTVWPGGVHMTVEDPISGIERVEHVGANYLESAKLDKAVELIHDFTESGQRTVVFSSFLDPLVELQRRFDHDLYDETRAVLFAGPTSARQRAEIVRNFNRNSGEEPKWDVCLAHYTLGGEGLNLTAATQVIILDEAWNPGSNNQAYARVDRMGQTEETGVHILRLDMPGSFDPAMAELLEAKQKIIDGFSDAVTFAQLAELFNS